MKSSGKSKSLGSGTKPSCLQDSTLASLHKSSNTFQNNSNKLGKSCKSRLLSNKMKKKLKFSSYSKAFSPKAVF